MSGLAEVFAKAKADNRAALVGYLPAGYPSRQGCIDALLAMVAGGAYVRDSVLWRGATVERDCDVEGSLVGPGVRGGQTLPRLRALLDLPWP